MDCKFIFKGYIDNCVVTLATFSHDDLLTDAIPRSVANFFCQKLVKYATTWA